jgi:hypothetical protein
MRGSYEPIYCNYTISGVDSFTNEGSSGADTSTKVVTNDTIGFMCGNNSLGYVAKWTNIVPKTDNITFTISGNDKRYLSAVKLVEEASGTSWHANETKSIKGTSNSTIFTKNLTNGESYIWNCLAYDLAGNSNWSVSNYTFEIDTSAPDINFTNPTPVNDTTQDNTDIYVNLSTSDTNDHYSFVDFDNDLLLWMRMDEIDSSGDPYDNSSYGNNGTAQDDAVQTGAGKMGRAFSFDGDGDYIDVGDPSDGSLDFGDNNFSVSAWFKSDDDSAENSIITKGGTSYVNAGYRIRLETSGAVSAYISNGTDRQICTKLPSTYNEIFSPSLLKTLTI